jgi:uncharacterized membrane protein YkoI
MKNVLVLFLAMLLIPASGQAGEADHDLAKHLKDSGEIIPLDKLIADVHRRYAGRILEVELEQKRGQYVYEIEMVDDDGLVNEYFYDAKTGELLWEEIQESEEHQ